MKVSMWMMHDALEQHCLRHTLDDRSKSICIKGVLPYIDTEQVSEAYLYVADASGREPLVLPPALRYLAVIGENFVAEDSGNIQIIVLQPTFSISKAFYVVNMAFSQYADWVEALQDELNSSQNLNSLCQLGRRLLDNDMMLYDREYTIIAGDFVMNSYKPEQYTEKNGPYFALSATALRQLKNEESFRQTFRQTGAALCRVDFLPYGVLYVNLGQTDLYEGRLCIMEKTQPFKNGDYQLAEILTGFIRLALKRQSIRSSERSRRFEAFLVSLLDGLNPDDDQLERMLQLWHWQRVGRYVCILMQQNELDAQTASDHYLVSQLALYLPGSCAVRYMDSIVCIASLKEKETAGDLTEKLAVFLKGFVPSLGVSDIYHDFCETALSYKQAVIASEMGAQGGNKTWCHFFRDYAMAHYFRFGTSVLPAIYYCDDNVKRLMPYQNSKTDYYSTLKVYLENNMNLLETSKALFIHRTTLFNRINKIRELISADLDKPEDRTRMLISFKLMEADQVYR